MIKYYKSGYLPSAAIAGTPDTKVLIVKFDTESGEHWNKWSNEKKWIKGINTMRASYGALKPLEDTGDPRRGKLSTPEVFDIRYKGTGGTESKWKWDGLKWYYKHGNQQDKDWIPAPGTVNTGPWGAGTPNDIEKQMKSAGNAWTTFDVVKVTDDEGKTFEYYKLYNKLSKKSASYWRYHKGTKHVTWAKKDKFNMAIWVPKASGPWGAKTPLHAQDFAIADAYYEWVKIKGSDIKGNNEVNTVPMAAVDAFEYYNLYNKKTKTGSYYKYYPDNSEWWNKTPDGKWDYIGHNGPWAVKTPTDVVKWLLKNTITGKKYKWIKESGENNKVTDIFEHYKLFNSATLKIKSFYKYAPESGSWYKKTPGTDFWTSVWAGPWESKTPIAVKDYLENDAYGDEKIYVWKKYVPKSGAF